MKTLLTLISLLLSLNLAAQKGKNGERIKALKVSYITEKLNLSSKESEKFWPIYNAYQQERNKIRLEEIRVIRKEIKEQIDTITDERAKILLTKINNAENKMHISRIKLTKKLSGFLSSKKIIQLKIAEENFKRKMKQKLRERGKGKKRGKARD